MKDVLHLEMCFIDFVHVTTIFLVSNDKAVSKIQKTRGKKLHNTICFLIIIMIILLRHTMLIRSFLIFEVMF